MNAILANGNNLYGIISQHVKKDFLLLTEVPEMVSIDSNIVHLDFTDSFSGALLLDENVNAHVTPKHSFYQVFNIDNCKACLLTIDANTVAVFMPFPDVFRIFYSHSLNMHGLACEHGYSVLISVEGVQNLVKYFRLFRNNHRNNFGSLFELRGVKCNSSNESDKEERVLKQNEYSRAGTKNTLKKWQNQSLQHRQNDLVEDGQQRLSQQREYKRSQRKKATEKKQNESLVNKQQRLLKQREYKRAQWKKAKEAKQNESVENKQQRLLKQRENKQTQRKKAMETKQNESLEDKQHRLLKQRVPESSTETKQNESLENKQQRLLKQREYKRAQRKQGNKKQNKRGPNIQLSVSQLISKFHKSVSSVYMFLL